MTGEPSPGHGSPPSSVFGHGHSHAEARSCHFLTDRVHVDDRVDALWPTFDTALRVRTEAAVVQALVPIVVAALLQGDSSGHSRQAYVDHQLVPDRKLKVKAESAAAHGHTNVTGVTSDMTIQGPKGNLFTTTLISEPPPGV